MKDNILIIDDDKRLRVLLQDYLVKKNFNVLNCGDFIAAKQIINFIIFDLIIIDRMMPGGDGINLISDIKDISNTPVLMLTALGEPINKIEGLKLGADDYLAKPFEPEELYLRIKKILENLSKKNHYLKLISFGNYTYNINSNQLKKGATNIHLTDGENNLMRLLALRNNQIVPREQLAGEEISENDLRKVDVQITRLRQKIELNPKQPIFIKTIRGKGYKLITN